MDLMQVVLVPFHSESTHGHFLEFARHYAHHWANVGL